MTAIKKGHVRSHSDHPHSTFSTPQKATNSPQSGHSLFHTLQRLQTYPQTLTAPEVIQLQRALGNRAVGALLRQPAASPGVIQRNAFLTRCANTSTGNPTQIDYVQVVNAGNSYDTDLGKLHFGIAGLVGKTLRRQATLQALEDENIANEVTAYSQAHLNGNLGAFVSTSTDIRSSHSGGRIDALLPQDAYDPGRPLGAAGGVGAVLPGKPVAATQGIRGPANWSWLDGSTERHTTHPDAGLLHGINDINRVASYFEYHFDTITDVKNKTKLLSGGRLVFDPFNHTFYVSEHYAAEYELINVPAVIADPAYNRVRQNIQAFRNQHAAMGGPNPLQWEQKIGRLMGAITEGRL